MLFYLYQLGKRILSSGFRSCARTSWLTSATPWTQPSTSVRLSGALPKGRAFVRWRSCGTLLQGLCSLGVQEPTNYQVGTEFFFCSQSIFVLYVFSAIISNSYNIIISLDGRKLRLFLFQHTHELHICSFLPSLHPRLYPHCTHIYTLIALHRKCPVRKLSWAQCSSFMHGAAFQG